MPGTLKSYLDQCIEAKMSLSEVEKKLKGVGWAPELIAQARQYYLTANSSTQPVKSQIANNGEPRPATNVAAKSKIETRPVPTIISSAAPVSGSGGKSIAGWLAIGFVVLVVLLAGAGGTAYLMAIDKLPVADGPLKSKITEAVFAIPFIPKTAKYILGSAVVKHQQVLESSFDLSLAAKTADFVPLTGTEALELRMKGYADFSDSRLPKFTIQAGVTDDFSGQLIKADDRVFYKIDRIPEFLTSLLGIDTAAVQPVLANWIVYETGELKPTGQISETTGEAEEQSGIYGAMQTQVMSILDDEALNKVKVSNEEADGVLTYKLSYVPTTTELDRMYTKFMGISGEQTAEISPQLPSDYLSDFSLTIWVDQNERYLRKVSLNFTLDSSGLETVGEAAQAALPIPDTSSTMSIEMELKLADFGRSQQIETPTEALSWEEYYALIVYNSPEYKGKTTEIESTANIENDVAQVTAAIVMYQLDNGNLPQTLEALIPMYLASREVYEDSGVVFRNHALNNDFLVFSTKRDLLNPEKPYIGIVASDGELTNFSQTEINAWGK